MGKGKMPEPAVRLDKLEKKFGAIAAVSGIDLEVDEGEFVTLLGPSGCGKTTTLNLIAGFLLPTSGSIYLKGRSVENLPSFRRDIGLVFQDYALFPHMTVAGNVAFGLAMRKVPKAETTRRVEEALDLVHLGEFKDRKPLQLSGGQRQRVALARALVIRPTVLLLDEPLSNLDLKLREQMRIEIINLQRQLGITTIFVTHDQGEALIMSDRIAVMNTGIVEQIGRPSDIYENPKTRFVAGFIGNMNFFTGRVTGKPDATGLTRIVTDRGLDLPVKISQTTPINARVHVAVRPERAQLLRQPPQGSDSVALKGRIAQILYLGSKREFHLEFDGGAHGVVEMPNEGGSPSFHLGDEVYMAAPLDVCLVLPAE
jgi:spermidine/putrescine ABC transporter ATP-binding subunit